MDEYWQVLQRIDAAMQADVARLASVPGELGLVEVSLVARQASHRLAFLTEFERLLANPDTREREVHEAIENNLWVLGSGYRVIASNKTTARIVAEYLDRKFVGERAGKRPDLLGVAIDREHVLLVELKRPSHTIGRNDENQAEKYRDDIQPVVPDLRIELLLVGGSRDSKMTTHYQPQNLRVTTYAATTVRARGDLGWMLEQLAS